MGESRPDNDEPDGDCGPTECTPAKPDARADYHEATECLGGKTPNEKYRCASCGAAWEV